MKQIQYSDLVNHVGESVLFKQVNDNGEETGVQIVYKLINKNKHTVFATTKGGLVCTNFYINDNPNYLIYTLNDFK